MFLRRLYLLLFLAFAAPAWSACRKHEITPLDKGRIADDSVMIVVHQSSVHDARFATKRGVDEAVRFAKSRKMPAIYLQDDTPDELYRMIEPTDPYHADDDRFLGIVTWGRPGGEHWPKLSVLETKGIVRREDHELDYIRKILPRWDRTFPDTYRIGAKMNDSVIKVLRTAPGWHPPTVLFHFVDSALNLDNPRLDGF